ncbi:MAG TPA: hypothetical protein DD789_11970 [Firmicutes bacterium]|nr:hypothetical protein [Bacillota bacterium]
MKKLIERFLTIMVICLIMMLVVSSIALAEDNIYKIGYLLASDASVTKSGSESKPRMGPSFAFSIERALEINEDFEMGFGTGLLLSGEFEDSDDKIMCVPIYLLLNYYPLSIEGLPYLTGHFGYNFLSYDDGNSTNLHGLYYAIGAGIRIVKYPSIRAEVLYRANNGSGTEDSYWGSGQEVKASLSRISLNLGLGF